MLNPTELVKDVGTMLEAEKAVKEGLIDEVGGIKEALDKGLTKEEAIKEEILSWEPEIVDILVNKFIALIKDQKPIDFNNLPDLRIYWRLRKIFSKEEVDNFSDIDYQWAIFNLQEDFKEAEEADDRNLEKRKAWMNLDLYNHLNKKEQEKQQEAEENKLLIQKLIEQQGIDSDKYQIELVEEEDIPTVIEEE